MISTKDILSSSIEIFIKNAPFSLQEDWNVGQAINYLRSQSISDKVHYFYVVNSVYKLTGILSTRKFLLSDPEAKIHDIMDRQCIKVQSNFTVEQTMEIFIKYQLLALPVVNAKGILLGVIDVYFCLKEAFDLPSARGNQDIFQLMGQSLQTNKKSSTFQGFRKRMPWLVFNLVGGLSCAIISDYYKLTLGTFLILAMFIPLVLTLSESTSMQAMTVSLYSLQSGSKFSFKLFLQRSWFEIRVAIILGVACGIIVGLAAIFWQDGFLPSIVIGVSILISICVSALFGGMLPLLLHGLRFDPKLAAGPIGLMIADILTTLIYLGLATTWLI